MILFYSPDTYYARLEAYKFQFHYDLILLIKVVWKWFYSFSFQFHYDLILFITKIKTYSLYKKISISLWSYSIKPKPSLTSTHILISISLWSYSIRVHRWARSYIYSYFNFIMILFYFNEKEEIEYCFYRFQFHYDLILF